ncbi:hypothetical protein EJ02DRAFT_330035, partial [Clathrospora elynae]
ISTASQLFPPAPTFSEASLLSLYQKVYINTGATSGVAGVGCALANILYNLHATVYIGAHPLEKFNVTVEALKKAFPKSKGALKPFVADMADLSTTKPAVESFLKEELCLDILFLNQIHIGSRSRTRGELSITFILTMLLLPLMQTRASHFCHPNPSSAESGIENFMQSKADVYFLTHEFANRTQTSSKSEQANQSAHTSSNSNSTGVQHIAVN